MVFTWPMVLICIGLTAFGAGIVLAILVVIYCCIRKGRKYNQPQSLEAQPDQQEHDYLHYSLESPVGALQHVYNNNPPPG